MGVLEEIDVPEVLPQRKFFGQWPARVCSWKRETDRDKYHLEEYYNLIHKWRVLSNHAGMFPRNVEEMLN